MQTINLFTGYSARTHTQTGVERDNASNSLSPVRTVLSHRDKHAMLYAVCSPSDLDADFEDNQDYDSTVSQSETKLPMFIPSSRVDSVQEVESPTSADSMSAMRPAVSDATELQRVISLNVQTAACRHFVWRATHTIFECVLRTTHPS